MRHALIFNVISFVTFALAVFFLLTRGLHLSVEFTGGTLIEVNYAQGADLGKIRDGLSKAGYTDIAVQTFGSSRDVMIRMPPKKEQNSAKIGEAVMSVLDAEAPGASLRRVEFVGPQVGKDLALNGVYATVFMLVGFLIYIAFRFEWKFAVVASLTALFDLLVTVAFVSLTGREFDLTVLAALMTLVGYSLNDTIVVFDRVRENFRKVRRGDTAEIMDLSMTETLSRTIITGMTAVMVLAALAYFGGEALYGFSIALMFGIVVGTYSSIYVGAPIILLWGVKRGETADDEPEPVKMGMASRP